MKGYVCHKMLKYFKDPKTVYIVISAIGLLGLLGALIVTKGRYFHWFLYADEHDTAMDFLNSLAETHGGDPYGRFTTLYTPLCNLFFFILSLMVPATVSDFWPDTHQGFIDMRNTQNDMRTQQSTLMLYLLYVVIFVIAWILCVSLKYYRAEIFGKKSMMWGMIIGATSMLTYSSLINIERGNVVNMTALFIMLFLFGYRSEHRGIRELSYVMLAIAAGLRMYPALFGIFLIADKDWQGAIKTVVYGLMSVVIPLFAFGGLSDLGVFAGQLMSFNGDEPIYMYNYGIKSVVYHVFGIGTDGRVTQVAAVDALSTVLLFAAAVVLIAAFFIHEQLWLKAFDIAILMTLIQSQGDDHVLIFFVPVLILMLLEEKLVNKGNAFYVLAVFLVTVTYPTHEISNSYYLTLFHSTIVQMVFVCMIVVEGVTIVNTRKIHGRQV